MKKDQLFEKDNKNSISWTAMIIPVVMVAGILLTLIVSYNRARINVVERAQQVLYDSAAEQKFIFQTKLDDQFGMLNTFAVNLALKDSYDMDLLKQGMHAVEENSDFSFVSFADTNGTLYNSDGVTVPDISDREYFIKCMEGKKAIEFISVARDDGKAYFTFAVPVIKNGDIKGAVCGYYVEKELRKFLLSEAFGRKAYSFITDKEGNIVIESNHKDYLMQENSTLSYNNILEILKDSKIEGANLDGIKQNIEQRKRGSFCYTLAEHQRYAVYIPLEEIDGFIFNMLPQEVVEEEISTGTKDILLTVLCVALFSGLIITYIIIRENIHRKKSEEEREMLRMSEEEYRIAAKQSGKFLARYNIMTKTLYQQESSAEIFGSGLIVENVPDSVYLTDNVSPESRDEYKSLFDQMNAGQATGSGNVCLKNKILNEYRWFQVDYTTIFTSDNVPQHSIITFYDNTKQREKELAYEHWNQTLTSIDGEKAFVFESNLTRDIFDPQARVLPGMLAELENYKSFNDRTHFFTNNFVHPDDVDACNSFLSRERLLMRFYAGSREEMMEYRVTIDGACKWYRLKVQMVQYPKSEEIKAYVIHSDINDEKLEKLALMARSQEDSLTGLLNRATFSEKVSELLLAMPGMQHVLVMIDIDNFKRVNDTLGHIRGDKILIDIAKSLKSILREGDLVGRIGGDEFMVFLKNIPYIDVIEKRAALMCRLLEIDASESVSISGSLGISLYPRDGVNFSQLYRCADIAVYKAKGNGRNRYEFYRAGIKMEDIKLESLPLEGQDFRAELEIARKNQINDIIFQNKALCVRQDEDERFRKIMENVGIATFEWNKISETYSSSLSFDEYEISRMDIRQFFGDNPDLSSIHPDDRALFCDVTLVGIDKKQKYTEIKVRLKLVGGDYVWVRLGTVVILDGNGSLKSIIGIVIRDGIKKRKSETRLEAIIKHMDSGVVVFELSEDGSTMPIYVSERYMSTADKTNVFDKDARIADFVLEEDRKKLLANIMNCAHSKELFDGVYRVVCDGKTHLRYVRATKIPYENIQNPVIAAIEINFDDE